MILQLSILICIFNFQGYGTVCTSSIMVKDFIVKLNMWRLSFCERYREENGNWSEHHENFCIANDYIPTWQRWSLLIFE